MPYLFLLIACLMLVLSGLVFYIPALQGWDVAQVKWFSQYRTESLNIVAMFLSKIGGSVVIGFVVLLWCSRLAWYKKYKTVIFISFGMIGSGTLVWLLKWWIARPRPLEIYHRFRATAPHFQVPIVYMQQALLVCCSSYFASIVIMFGFSLLRIAGGSLWEFHGFISGFITQPMF